MSQHLTVHSRDQEPFGRYEGGQWRWADPSQRVLCGLRLHGRPDEAQRAHEVAGSPEVQPGRSHHLLAREELLGLDSLRSCLRLGVRISASLSFDSKRRLVARLDLWIVRPKIPGRRHANVWEIEGLEEICRV